MNLSPLLDTLQDLLDSLRRDQYSVGMGEFMAARALLLRLLEQDLNLPPAAEADALRQEAGQRLQGMLGALLCRNAAEQERFSAHFWAWLEAQAGETAAPGVPSPSLAPEEIPSRNQTRRNYGLLLLGILALGSVFWVYDSQPPPVKPETPIVEPLPGEKPGPTPVPNPADTRPPEPPVQAPPPPETWAETLWRETPPWLPWLLFIPLLPWLIQRLNRRYLRRRLGSGGPELARLRLNLPAHRIFQAAALGKTL